MQRQDEEHQPGARISRAMLACNEFAPLPAFALERHISVLARSPGTAWQHAAGFDPRQDIGAAIAAAGPKFYEGRPLAGRSPILQSAALQSGFSSDLDIGEQLIG